MATGTGQPGGFPGRVLWVRVLGSANYQPGDTAYPTRGITGITGQPSWCQTGALTKPDLRCHSGWQSRILDRSGYITKHVSTFLLTTVNSKRYNTSSLPLSASRSLPEFFFPLP
jgi:hypothetical protein